jgi:hypothetical protein
MGGIELLLLLVRLLLMVYVLLEMLQNLLRKKQKGFSSYDK